MIEVGQYVRAVLAEGIAAALPETEGLEPQLDREGLVVEVHPALGTLMLENFFGHQCKCYINGAVVVDMTTLDSYQHNVMAARALELSLSEAR